MANESVETKKYFWYELGKKVNAFLKKIKFDQWKGWLYLSPALVLLLIFTVWPIFNTVRMSLLEGYTTRQEIVGKTFEFGIGNFLKVIEYKRFLQCLKNTCLLCVLTVPISTLLALLIAGALGFLWYRNNHIFVDGDAYPIDSDSLDLTGEDISIAYYEALQAKLPDCAIIWNVPFQNVAL